MKETDKIDYILEHLNHPETLTDSEFISWLQEEKHFRLFEEVRMYRETLFRDNQQSGFYIPDEYQHFQQQIKQKFRIKWMRVAAACVIVGLTTLLWIYYPNSPSYMPLDQEIPVGRKTAELILADGRQINLEGNVQEIQEKNENIATNSTSCELTYRESRLLENSGEQVWHTLKIPARADYFVKLSDGTKIWLNCDSELKFPVNFTKDSREVFLEGEAYFEVAKAESWPFIVRTNKMDIQVTGTKFNVKSYKSEPLAQTTLVEGSVWVNQMKLNPSQQFLLDKNSGNTEIKMVDTELYTGWIEGMFVFQSQRLEDVMNGLAKWYDVTVTYKNHEIKEMRFSGNFGRYDTIDDVLDILRKLEKVNFNRTDRSIIVSKR